YATRWTGCTRKFHRAILRTIQILLSELLTPSAACWNKYLASPPTARLLAMKYSSPPPNAPTGEKSLFLSEVDPMGGNLSSTWTNPTPPPPSTYGINLSFNIG